MTTPNTHDTTATAHTPGPWKERHLDTPDIRGCIDFYIRPSDDEEGDICHLSTFFDTSRDNAEHQANATLLAAAPMLLANLQNLTELAESDDQFTGQGAIPEVRLRRMNAIEQARAAIARATSNHA